MDISGPMPSPGIMVTVRIWKQDKLDTNNTNNTYTIYLFVQ